MCCELLELLEASKSVTSRVIPLKLRTCNTMGLLDLMLPWITRAAVLVSVVLLTLTTLRRHSDIPLSQATLRVAHLCSFRYYLRVCLLYRVRMCLQQLLKYLLL